MLVTTLIYQLSQRRAQMMRNWIRNMTIKQLPAGYEVDTHFKPVYNPWDQRLCLVPDGDLFRAIRNQRASVVTGRIATFTEHGLRLESGEELEADIVVTATGLQLLALGGIELTVDGRAIRLPDTMAYKGMMLSGVPNFAFTIGYTNASWTLKADLVSEFVCRLLAYMDSRASTCSSRSTKIRASPSSRLLDFSAGYVLRAIDQLPGRGSRAPWRLGMSYLSDALTLRHGKIDDGGSALQCSADRAASGSGPEHRARGDQGRAVPGQAAALDRRDPLARGNIPGPSLAWNGTGAGSTTERRARGRGDRPGRCADTGRLARRRCSSSPSRAAPSPVYAADPTAIGGSRRDG